MELERAEGEARRRNLELGERGVAGRYFVEVQRPDGSWTVAEHEVPPPEPPSRWDKLLQLALEALRFW